MNKIKLIIGCNYHTKWQSEKSMRFVLVESKGDKARLQTRVSKKDFWTNVSDLIFINTKYNKDKAIRLSKNDYNCSKNKDVPNNQFKYSKNDLRHLEYNKLKPIEPEKKLIAGMSTKKARQKVK